MECRHSHRGLELRRGVRRGSPLPFHERLYRWWTGKQVYGLSDMRVLSASRLRRPLSWISLLGSIFTILTVGLWVWQRLYLGSGSCDHPKFDSFFGEQTFTSIPLRFSCTWPAYSTEPGLTIRTRMDPNVWLVVGFTWFLLSAVQLNRTRRRTPDRR